MRAIVFAFPGLLLALPALPVAAAPGPLVIAGGAIAPDNGPLVRAFLDRRPAGRPVIAVVPAASSEPAGSFAAAVALFVSHGARAEDIRLIPLAVLDDPETPEDEAGWAGGGRVHANVATVREAGAIWFTGGDQSRIMATLVEKDGSPTPLLLAVRAAHAAGAVVGGTSAGAAVMSNPMLTGGDPLAAVAGPGEGREAIGMAPGLGLFTAGVVDQHFSQRGRLPRLLAVLEGLPASARLGFGIDENSAMVVEDGRVLAVGAGLLTLVDARRAHFLAGEGLGAADLRLHYLSNGQSQPLPRD
jgi:cyanophycinase